VYVANAGVPHFLGPRISFIEVQEPSDHLVIPEIDPDADVGAATMGLGWDEALDMIDYEPATRDQALGRARQSGTVPRRHRSSQEVGLFDAEARAFFDASRLDIADELPIEDERFYIGIVLKGDGAIEGDFGSEQLRPGQTFACAASLGHRFRAGREPLTVIRAMGPGLMR
jgi:mannose-6-phosphate isomerase